MKSVQIHFSIVVLFVKFITTLSCHLKGDDYNIVANNETTNVYCFGVYMGIINPKKYPLQEFERDENTYFRTMYQQYVASMKRKPLIYRDWLVMNNFGILSDTQASLLEKKTVTRSRNNEENKKRFLEVVKKGDILITRRGMVGWLVGHAAIMSSDYWVLEMSGRKKPDKRSWKKIMSSNNRQIAKDKWYDEHSSDWTTVYRCSDPEVAIAAATWANITYYNTSDENNKAKHIIYAITTDIWKIDPSYCSKLVMHAYYYGTGEKKVTRRLTVFGRIIVPTAIPWYFLNPYKLVNLGKF